MNRHHRKTKRTKPDKETRALARKFYRAGFTPETCRERADQVERLSHRREWLAMARAMEWMSAAVRAERARARRDAASAPAFQLETPRTPI